MSDIQNKPERIVVSNSTPLFFTSDLHFFHNRIVEFTKRPISIDLHNDWVVNTLNNYIKPTTNAYKAQVYHLGDFLFSCTNEEAVRLLECLNGTWNFVLGNHDNVGKLQTIINTVNQNKGTNHKVLGWYYRLTVVTDTGIPGTKLKKKHVVLCHFPIADWEAKDRGSYHLYGHLHGGGSTHGSKYFHKVRNSIDVGIDACFNYLNIHKPLTWDEVVSEIRKQRDE